MSARQRIARITAAVIAAAGLNGSAARAAVEATIEAQQVVPAMHSGEPEGIFRLEVAGVEPTLDAPALRSEATPIFQVVPYRAEGGSAAAGAANGPNGRWTYFGRYHGTVPDRFELLAEARDAQAAPRQIAALQAKLLPPHEGEQSLREQWIRLRLRRIDSEMLAPGQPDFWAYQHAYSNHLLNGTPWQTPGATTWRPRRPTGLLGSMELVTGMDAVEESLQLSVLRNPTTGEPEPQPRADIPLSEMAPPQIESHDFVALQKGLPPAPVPEEARFACEDSLFLWFSSVNGALRMGDQAAIWQRALAPVSDLVDVDGSAQTFLSRLGLQVTPQLRPFYGIAVDSIGVVLDDPYLAEGAEMSLILRARSESVLDLRLAQFDDAALREHPGLAIVEHSDGVHRLRELHAADGSIRSFRCAVGRYRIYSTSLAALRRVLEAWDGRARRLADAADFRYVRSVLPGGDGFLYFSDACVRRFVSPGFKLTELRRVRCLANLRVLDDAADLSDLEQNPKRSVPALVDADYLARAPRCPSGGPYSY